MKKLNIAGHKYGRLLAIEPTKTTEGRSSWEFLCDCGARKIIRMSHVRAGKIVSCGCFRVENASSRLITHGHSVGGKESREIKSYHHAKSRCFNENDKKFKTYGARGITMCDEWRDDPSKFLSYMGNCPPKYTLDRINNDGNYEPGNCRWATKKQQASNRRTSIMVEHDGVAMTLTEYSEIRCVNYGSIRSKIFAQGFSPQAAADALLKLYAKRKIH